MFVPPQISAFKTNMPIEWGKWSTGHTCAFQCALTLASDLLHPHTEAVMV